MKLFDCCFSLTPATAAQFKSAGYDGVARYLVNPATEGWKAITKPEADIISAAGLKIISVFETTADRTLSDYAAGVADAKEVMQFATAVGQPTGSAIYFAVDFEASSDQISGPISGYFSGVHDTLVGYDVGVYGDYDVCTALKGKGLVTHTWMCYAWSNHQLMECNVYQYLNGPNGADYDEDLGLGFEGAWTTNAAPAVPVATAPPMDPGYALTILRTWMEPAWKAANDQYTKTNNAAYKQQADYIRLLGLALRHAANLPDDMD